MSSEETILFPGKFFIGTDLVFIPRLKKAIQKYDKRFLHRVFTSGEQEYCLSFLDPYTHLAARFAAKEAFYKAIRSRQSVSNKLNSSENKSANRNPYPKRENLNIHWVDIEVIKEPKQAPMLKVSGQAYKICQENHIKAAQVSLSHHGDYALAVVLLEE